MQGHNSNVTTDSPGSLTEVHHDCLGVLGPGHCHACSGTFYSSSYPIRSVLEFFALVQSRETKGKPPICVFKAKAENFMTLGPVAGSDQHVPRSGPSQPSLSQEFMKHHDLTEQPLVCY